VTTSAGLVAGSRETAARLLDRGSLRRVVTLTAPILGAVASTNLMNLVDTAMVGRLGSTALASVGLAVVVHWLVGSVFLGLSAGVQTLTARAKGSGDAAAAQASLRTGLTAALALGVAIATALVPASGALMNLASSDATVADGAAGYLSYRVPALAAFGLTLTFRGYWTGLARPGVYLGANVLMNATNIALNWVFIFGHLGSPVLGVRGAGLASAAAMVVGVGYYLVATRGALFTRPSTDDDAPPRALLALSWPHALENVLMYLGVLVFFAIASRVGVRVLAVSNVLAQIILVFGQFALAFGISAATLAGLSIGAGDVRGAGRWIIRCAVVAFALAVGPALVLLLYPEAALGALMSDTAAVRDAVPSMMLLAVALPIDVVGVVLFRALVGVGAVRAVLVASVVLQWFLFLPSAGLLAHVSRSEAAGLTNLFFAMVGWRVGATIAGLALFTRGRWRRQSSAKPKSCL